MIQIFKSQYILIIFAHDKNRTHKLFRDMRKILHWCGERTESILRMHHIRWKYYQTIRSMNILIKFGNFKNAESISHPGRKSTIPIWGKGVKNNHLRLLPKIYARKYQCDFVKWFGEILTLLKLCSLRAINSCIC